MLIYQALLDAVSQLPASVQPGILIDEQYGAAIAGALARYQRLRLGPAVAHVSGSERATAAYLAQAGR